MKKRLAFLTILFASIFCMFGCNNDPYKNMTLEYTGDSVVQLNIEEITVDGKTSYSYDPYTFDVKVGNVGSDVDKKIYLTGGEDLVDYSLSYVSDGVTRVVVTPLSYVKTGKFTLTINTVEGNRSKSLDFQVDLKINNFVINDESLKVVAKGQSIDLSSIEKYITFTPQATSQKNIEFSVVRPVGNVIEGHSEQTYVFNDESTDVYAKVENKVLSTYKNVEYPKMVETIVVGGNESQVLTQCITLNAVSLDNPNIPARFVDIIVIEDCDKMTLRMNAQKNDSASGEGNSFAVEKNEKTGEYDVVLLNPNYRYGIRYDNYYIERDLIFDFGELSDDGTYNPNDYVVTTSSVSESENMPVALSYSALDNSFKVQAQKSGTYSHKFKIDHVDYPNIINKEVVVNFTVLDVPTDIKINGNVKKDEYKIYKTYGNSWGARFTVSLLNASNYNYFVFLKDGDLNNSLKFYKADGSEQVFAIAKDEGGITNFASAKEGIGYSNFKSNETFYLRHNFDTLPNENVQIYIGVLYDVMADSYSDEIKNNYFYQSYLEFPINLSFEMGLESIDYTQSKYSIDVTNTSYNNNIYDSTGIKLLDLPSGQTVESAIGRENIVYDKSLITVYDVFDDIENRVSLYIKCNDSYKTGKTNIIITSKNGLKKSVQVSTFIPTVYAENENLTEDQKMPLSIGFNEGELLYYFSGKDDNNPKLEYSLYKTTNDVLESWASYTSLKRLFMLKDSNMSLKIYDYLLTYLDSEQTIKNVQPIDVTSQTSITFSDPGYAQFSNGRLYAFKVTEDINNPVIMRLTYTSGYSKINDEGIEEYVTYTVTQDVELYIYLALQGVQVTTPKTVDIYVDESLGIYNKDLSRHTIISDFIPNEVKLGAQWNQRWFNSSLPVSLNYDFEEILNTPIYLSDGSAFVIYSLDGSKSRALKYGDLFRKVDGDAYTCPIYCKINDVSSSASVNDSLDYWIKYESGYGLENYDWFVKNRIFNNSIVLTVNVYITQFSKLQNINSVKFSVKYADKISNFDIDVPESGIYFEKRANSTTSDLTVNIAYSVEGNNAVNKEIMLINANNIVFSASVNANQFSSVGTIKIVGLEAGINYLIAVPKDNIKGFDESTKTYLYYNDSLVQTFRVKVADGSESYPFEISNADDFVKMQEDISTGNYYNYVLTNDISSVKDLSISFVNITSENVDKLNDFSLNGKFSYFRNNIEYTRYSKIYNLVIKRTLNNLSNNINLGLFDSLNEKVVLKNLTITNARIDVYINALNGKELNVGILAGNVNGAKIYNCDVTGNINIYNYSADTNSSNINIGGMIGKSKNTLISGIPNSYVDGYNNNKYNANVSINYSKVENKANGVSNALENHKFNVGGLVGIDSENSVFENINIMSTIIGTNYNSSVGGAIGKANYSTISNLVVYPIISISDSIVAVNHVINVSTLVGSAGEANIVSRQLQISSSKVYFVKEDVNSWKNALAVSVVTNSKVNFGGVVANLNNNNAEIEYTFVRSFYTQNLNDKYYANIYIDANNGYIGGLIGNANNKSFEINSCYFQADILTNGINVSYLNIKNNVGLLLGDAGVVGSNSSIKNSYGISRITVRYVNNSIEYFEELKGINEKANIFGNLPSMSDSDSSVIDANITIDGTIKDTNINNLKIDNVYGVINSNTYYLGKNDSVIGIYNEDKVLLGQNGMLSLMGNQCLESDAYNLFKTIGYEIVEDKANAVATSTDRYLWNSKVNLVGNIAFPILLNETRTKALYDLIPERILVDRIASNLTGLYDISTVKTENNETYDVIQLLMFVNKNELSSSKNYFDIELDSDSSAVSIKFDGQTIVTSFIEFNSDLAISENSSGKIISLQGFRVYPVADGVAKLTISSVLDKTVKLDITIKVVSGITSVSLIPAENTDTKTDGEKEIAIAYIDELSELYLQNENVINGTIFNSSNDYAYKLEILESVGKVNINGRDLKYDESQDNSFIINTKTLRVRGVEIGNFKFNVYPVVYLDDVEHGENNYIVLDNICNTYEIVSMARAKSIQTTKNEIKIAPKNTTTLDINLETSNVIIKENVSESTGEKSYIINILDSILINVGNTEKAKLKFSKTVGDDEYLIDFVAEYDGNGNYYISSLNTEFENELIKLIFNGLKVSKSSSSNTYNILISANVIFNQNYYRLHADEFDLNTISYDIQFVPDSNTKLNARTQISISPNITTQIFTNYYTRGELLINTDNESYPAENESRFVIPGTYGLLKITLDEEFNDSSYMTVTLPNEYKDYVTLSQMAGVTQVLNLDSDNISEYIDSYKDIKFRNDVSNSSEYGIELSKLTINYNNDNYFCKTYFVKVYLTRNYGNLTSIPLRISSFKVENGVVTKNLEVVETYNITELPLLNVKVDNEYSANLGKGIRKPIEIVARSIENNIAFTGLNDNVYIADEDGRKVNVLDIDYINSGKTYYLCADVESNLDTLNINFKTDEYVWGVRETCSSDLKIQVVDFEIESITIDRIVDGVVTIKHGENMILNTSISYKTPVVGDETKLNDYINYLNSTSTSIVDLAEYVASGVTVIQSNTNQTMYDGKLRLSYGVANGDSTNYVPMTLDKNFDYIKLGSGVMTTADGLYRLEYYTLKGIGITGDNVKLRLVVPYTYNQGKLVVTDEILGYTTLEIDFEVKVEDSSTYDRPNPIENQNDLILACNSNGGDYILVNNIDLTNWTPIDATFNSLDGNGYVLNLKSFNLTAIRSEDTANVGIFANVSSTTTLKNITVDVKDMLISESEMLSRLDKVANSTEDSYLFDANIDLAYIQNVNFGILAGTNNGAITNAKIINTLPTEYILASSKLYFAVVTTQGYLDGNTLASANIGGLVGVNSSTGAITNSFVGLNKNNDLGSYVEIVTNPSEAVYNNEQDNLNRVQIYSFAIAGGRNIAGMVANNSGIISNSYAKGVGVYNTFPAVKDSMTAGLVANNSGVLTSTFVESAKIENYRGLDDNFKIESTGNVGGLVYTNSGTIENSYSNVYVETQSAFTGGFVFINTETGSISNSYTTTVNRNSLARGQFTGVDANGLLQNSGKYYNTYYLVLDNESVNDIEDATGLDINSVDISTKNAWRGFSFATSGNSEGIWILSDNSTPIIASSTIDTMSFRRLTDSEEITEDNSTYTVYSYEYIGNNLGSERNPLIIDNASNFAKYIIDNANEVLVNGRKRMVFGVTDSSENYLSQNNNVRFVRIINNLDFTNIITSTKHKDTYLYNVIFAGVLDGNGMTLKNLNLNTDTIQLEDFGLFAQIGVESNISSKQSIIKNLNVTLRTYKSSDSSRSGVLAGTIINSQIINVSIDGGYLDNNAIVVGARNMAGALAGLIYADDNGYVSLYDIDVNNIAVESTYGSLGGEITEYSTDVSNGFYNRFKIRNVETQSDVEKEFVSIYNKLTNKTELFNGSSIRTDVSYAGSVAGVILANNLGTIISAENELNNGLIGYRSNPDENTIDNIVVSGSVLIRTSDNAGGLFGYVGENTLIKNSKFELGENQLIKAFNYAGGIVAENHGIIEQCSVAYVGSIQNDIDAGIVNTQQNSDYDYKLFGDTDATDYTVAIGGIAGYSNNGVIIDSINKINVIKPLSYIAGGIVGYSENYNYIASSYQTGAVYSKFVTGGIVGLQVSANLDKQTQSKVVNGKTITVTMHKALDTLRMDNVYSLTNWNYSNENLDIRQKTTEKLYENQKVMYSKPDGGYYKFYVKMPEIGNLNVTNSNEKYANLHNEYYVGSVVGFAIINGAENTGNKYLYISNSSKKMISALDLTNDIENIDFESLNQNELLYNYGFADNVEVYSNTLGIYTTTGAIESGTKQDNYFGQTFNYAVDSANAINMYSYRIAYIDSLNNYSLIDIDETKSDSYFDNFVYPQIYNQEYLEQLIGAYYDIVDSTSKSTANVFKYSYNASDRFTKNISNSTLINSNSDHIWAMDNYLPKLNLGVFTTGKVIKNANDLQNALSNISSGRIYRVLPSDEYGNAITIESDYKITMPNIVDTNKVIAYSQTIRDLFVGVKLNDKNPKIIFEITNADGKDNSTINSIFNVLSGVTISNIDFVINYRNVNFEANKRQNDFGLFANVIQNTNFSDCSFEINILNDIELQIDNNNANSVFESKNIGLLFGRADNSTISNCKISISAKNVALNNENITNFGVVIGSAESTSLVGNSINLNIGTITNLNSDNNISIGGAIGYTNYTTIKDNIISYLNVVSNSKELKVINENSVINANISALVGVALNSSIANMLSNVQFVVENKAEVGSLNVANIVALSNATNVSGVTAKGEQRVSDTSNKVNTFNSGSIIANDLKSSTLGNELVSSSVLQNLLVSSENVNVGGLIGVANNSTNAINLGEFVGEINVTNENIGKTTSVDGENVYTYSGTSVGGIIGKASGLISISNILSAGKINVKTKEIVGAENEFVNVNIGGIIGVANSNSEINNFTVITTMNVSNSSGTTSYSDIAEVYVSGVVGLNEGVNTTKNGLILTVLPDLQTVQTYAVTNNSIGKSTENVFVSMETLSKNYKLDSNFDMFAIADVYFDENVTSYSSYSKLGKLIDSNHEYFNKNNLANYGKLKIIVPNGTHLPEFTCDASNLGSVYNPKILCENTSDSNITGFNVVLDYLNITGITINKGAVISGRTGENGCAIITTNATTGATDTVFAVGENNGVISNVYFKTSGGNKQDLDTSQNVALVNENNGLIIHVFAYGLTENEYSIANVNTGNGVIVMSVSSVIYVGHANNTENGKDIVEIYGLVNTNQGYMSDIYSNSFAHTENNEAIAKVYGFANINTGTIEYGTYFVPEIMEYENTCVNYVKTNYDSVTNTYGKINQCENNLLPRFVDTKSNIWTTQNNHAQIVGLNDIVGDIVVKLKMNDDIYDVGQMKVELSNKNTSDVRFEYVINFYSTEILSYNLIRFNSGEKFTNYINNLTYSMLPENAIVVIDGELKITQFTEFSIPGSSMIIGTTYLKDGVLTNSSIEYASDTFIQNSLIKYNYGVIANINFKSFKINNGGESRYFAPIMYNYGIVYGIKFTSNSVVRGGNSIIVAGIVAINTKSGIMNCSGVDSFSITSNEYYNFICNENYGKVYSCFARNVTGSSTRYPNGKDGMDDND